MGRIIAFSGTHGTGKTTAVYNRISELKKAHPDLLIGPHVENLVFCPYPINRESTEESQLWVFTNHIQAELFLLSHYDVVVSDRSAVDAIAYTSAFGFKVLAERMLDLVQSHMDRYAEIRVMLAKENNHLHADGLRDGDATFRDEVEFHLLWAYTQLGYNIELTGHGYSVAVKG